MALGQLNFLQLTNRVLMRLGKSQTSQSEFATTTGDDWPAIVKDFINDAQAEIYKEHDWSTLVQSASFTQSARTKDISSTIEGFGREISLTDTTNGFVLEPVSLRQLHQIDPQETMEGPPRRYSIQYPIITFERVPASVAYKLRYLARPDALSGYADASDLPEYCDMPMVWWAVWQLAASREDNQDRGETARDIFDKSLARAIGQDRRRMDRIFAMEGLYPSAGLGRMPANAGSNYEPM